MICAGPLGVDEWMETMQLLKDSEEEVGNIMRDREILWVVSFFFFFSLVFFSMCQGICRVLCAFFF
jgi:hypothetical protein